MDTSLPYPNIKYTLSRYSYFKSSTEHHVDSEIIRATDKAIYDLRRNSGIELSQRNKIIASLLMLLPVVSFTLNIAYCIYSFSIISLMLFIPSIGILLIAFYISVELIKDTPCLKKLEFIRKYL